MQNNNKTFYHTSDGFKCDKQGVFYATKEYLKGDNSVKLSDSIF